MTYKEIVDNIAYAIDTLRITRRVGFYFTLWITLHAFQESVVISKAIEDPLGAAAVIAALMVPISALQGAALNFHHKHSKREPE